jgi:hypothetical protein
VLGLLGCRLLFRERSSRLSIASVFFSSDLDGVKEEEEDVVEEVDDVVVLVVVVVLLGVEVEVEVELYKVKVF